MHKHSERSMHKSKKRPPRCLPTGNDSYYKTAVMGTKCSLVFFFGWRFGTLNGTKKISAGVTVDLDYTSRFCGLGRLGNVLYSFLHSHSVSMPMYVSLPYTLDEHRLFLVYLTWNTETPVTMCDARKQMLESEVPSQSFDCVIVSPPRSCL